MPVLLVIDAIGDLPVSQTGVDSLKSVADPLLGLGLRSADPFGSCLGEARSLTLVIPVAGLDDCDWLRLLVYAAITE